MNNTYMRQLKIFNPEKIWGETNKQAKEAKILIIGAGNIGSNTAFALAKLGLQNITIMDYDTIEEHNLSTQLYTTDQIGQKKIVALKYNINMLTPQGTNIKIIDGKTPEDLEDVYDIIILAVDNIKARAETLAILPNNTWVIDGRMGQQQIEIHTSKQPSQIRIPEKESEDECAEKFVSYTSLAIAAFITATVQKILTEETPPKSQILDFKTNYLIVKN